MDNQAQTIAARTLTSIKAVRRACEGKPRKGEDGTRNIFSDIFGKDGGDVLDGLDVLFNKRGKQ